MYKHSLALCGLFIFIGCQKNPTGTDSSEKMGVISLHISAGTFPFQAIAKSATAKITATDMKDVNAGLTITDSSVRGEVQNVPSGKARKIEVTVYDSSSSPIYRGSTVADINADTSNKVTLNINRIVGAVSINGSIVEAPSGRRSPGIQVDILP